MAVGFKGLPKLLPVEGFRLGTACAGIKKPGRRDVVLMEITAGASVAAVFTRNAFCAAPVVLAKEHLRDSAPRYLLVNTGNANAGTGARGLDDARSCCVALAEVARCSVREVLPFSTGVIGEPLPSHKIITALPEALAALNETAWEQAATGIMTTDTVPKATSRKIEIDGRPVVVTGMAKGAGMIRPDMATMLAYIATDAQISQAKLQTCLEAAVNVSFNRVTIDGDTSTNDSCVLVATGKSGVNADSGTEFDHLAQTITDVCQELAQAIVRDGEGATKFITVVVKGGAIEKECEQVAYAIGHSPLVKTAFFASDPNWGRILAAVGRAGVHDLKLDAVTIHLGDVCIVRDGGRAPDYEEEKGIAVMKHEEITITVDLQRGRFETRIWTCDFSYDYVKINAEYRT